MPWSLFKNVRSHNPFASFAPDPVGISFENQEENEEIILFLRAHIVTLIPPALLVIFLIFAPVLINAFINFLGFDLSFITASQDFLINLFYYILVFAYAFYRFVFWYFNVYILTNERIVDFDFRGILNKEISYTTLDHIEDVEPKTIGFFGTFFNYGNVFLQTAAERPEFEFSKVPRPDAVAEAILEQVRAEEGESPGVVS